MVSLREFLEESALQEQLQDRLDEIVQTSQAKKPLLSKDVKDLITFFAKSMLESYITNVIVEPYTFETPEDIRDACEQIAAALSPDKQASIMQEVGPEEAMRLVRQYHKTSKRQLPC